MRVPAVPTHASGNRDIAGQADPACANNRDPATMIGGTLTEDLKHGSVCDGEQGPKEADCEDEQTEALPQAEEGEEKEERGAVGRLEGVVARRNQASKRSPCQRRQPAADDPAADARETAPDWLWGQAWCHLCLLRARAGSW